MTTLCYEYQALHLIRPHLFHSLWNYLRKAAMANANHDTRKSQQNMNALLNIHCLWVMPKTCHAKEDPIISKAAI